MEIHTCGFVQPLRRQTRALLAYLVATGQARSRPFLYNLLFSETADPAGALRWHLSQIRRRLGGDALVVEGDLVQFNQQSAWADCVEFRRILRRPLAELTQEQLQVAIDLYRGEFLEALSLPDAPEYELWALSERAAFRRLYIRALDEINARLIAAHLYDLAITYAQRRLQLDPLVEAAHGQLIWLYAQTGQRQAAFRQYQQCRKILHDELAVEPSHELQELYTKLKQRISNHGAVTIQSGFTKSTRINSPVNVKPTV
jgi:DNA-binding SARP family transcriptional activator